MLWNGSAASVVNLNPAGFTSSQANAVLNGVQGGFGVNSSTGSQAAMIWTGTASSAVDLNPAGYYDTQVLSLGNGFQVGTGFRTGNPTTHLLLWHGTAASTTDITPGGLTNDLLSFASGTGPYIVGSAGPSSNANPHAYLWSIYGQSTDLQATLPTFYTTSAWYSGANGVDSLGNVVGYVQQAGVATYGLLWWSAGPISGPTFTLGVDTLSQSITIDAAKSMNISSVLTIPQGCSLVMNGGAVTAGTTKINFGGTLSGQGTIQGAIIGDAGSYITATGNLSLGNTGAFNSFNTSGELDVGAAAVTINSEGFATLGGLTTVSGGTLIAPNGISIGVGCNLSGSGTVQGKVAAGYGSTIQATGNLTLGDSTSPVGFVSDGELYTGSNTVTLNSRNAANNKNAVVLGSLTQIDGGGLVAQNGILLSSGFNLVTTDNGGTVSGGSNSRFLNLGNVQGPSPASNNWLTFNMLFKGGTGQTSGRIDFAGGFATGDSPGVNAQIRHRRARRHGHGV